MGGCATLLPKWQNQLRTSSICWLDSARFSVVAVTAAAATAGIPCSAYSEVFINENKKIMDWISNVNALSWLLLENFQAWFFRSIPFPVSNQGTSMLCPFCAFFAELWQTDWMATSSGISCTWSWPYRWPEHDCFLQRMIGPGWECNGVYLLRSYVDKIAHKKSRKQTAIWV